MAPTLVLASLAALATPSFPALPSTGPSLDSVPLVTPASAALALGLTATICIGLTVRRMRRARHVDCEASANTTAAGTPRKPRVHCSIKYDYNLNLTGLFASDDKDEEHDPVDASWFFSAAETRGQAPETRLKLVGDSNLIQISAGDVHTPIEAVVEEFQPENLDICHLFAVAGGYEGEDDEDFDFEFPYWEFGQRMEEVIKEVVHIPAPSLQVAAFHAPCSVEVESDDLQFGYFFHNGFEEDEEDDAVEHDFDEVSGVPSGYPIASPLSAVGSQTPPSVIVLDVKTARFASPVKTSGARHVARKAGKVYPVILKAPPRSTSAVFAPRVALATVKINRTSSLKTVGSGVKGKKDEEKENLGGKRNSDRRNSSSSNNNNNKPARFITRFPRPS
ncbi:hypothetical protein K438DRAFT_1961881 [Mycena galopus ATCC 62051]|nr:hypothetical protein K438DRAFT_1961881 [Mycena galopus ATCC 62051]